MWCRTVRSPTSILRYPDEVYLAQVRQMVDDAARGAALATGTKVSIEPYGSMRDGISVGALNEVAFAYLREFGATRVMEMDALNAIGHTGFRFDAMGLSALLHDFVTDAEFRA